MYVYIFQPDRETPPRVLKKDRTISVPDGPETTRTILSSPGAGLLPGAGGVPLRLPGGGQAGVQAQGTLREHLRTLVLAAQSLAGRRRFVGCLRVVATALNALKAPIFFLSVFEFDR